MPFSPATPAPFSPATPAPFSPAPNEGLAQDQTANDVTAPADGLESIKAPFSPATPDPNDVLAQQGDRSGGLSSLASTATDAQASDSSGVGDGTLAAAGIFAPPGRFVVPETVGDSLRYQARNLVEDIIEEGVEGNYSPDFLRLSERLTPDQLVDIADQGLSGRGLEVSHDVAISADPTVGTEASNLDLSTRAEHLAEHGGDFSQNPAEYRNPTWEEDTVANEQFGEGSNLHVQEEENALTEQFSAAEDRAGSQFLEEHGFTSSGAEATEATEATTTAAEATEATTVATEATEGASLLVEGTEAATVAVEAAEGFEVADLLILLLFL